MMQQAMDLHGIALLCYSFLNGVLGVREIHIIHSFNTLLLLQVGEITVFCNLAKPDTDVCFAAKMIYGTHCLKKSFACDLFCNAFVF